MTLLVCTRGEPSFTINWCSDLVDYSGVTLVAVAVAMETLTVSLSPTGTQRTHFDDNGELLIVVHPSDERGIKGQKRLIRTTAS